MKTLFASLAAGALVATAIGAVSPVVADGPKVQPVRDAVVLKECGACHMAFPAGFLPTQSWTTMMAGLAEHFGENAELDADTARHITGYLTANAADAGRPTRGAPQAIPLLRITETAWWRRKHEKKGRVSPETMTRRGAKLKSDCVACHQDAARGMFDDD